MLKIGINGFGRIGRAIFRILLNEDDLEVCAINDTNADIKNLAYLLKYDSIYGILDNEIYSDSEGIFVDGSHISVTNNEKINQVNWHAHDLDIIIDSSGINYNVLKSFEIERKGKLKHVIITHTPKEIDFSMILGVNEHLFNPKVNYVFSSSICDATAITPVIKLINEKIGIQSGFITTLHPWLNYQNLMDGNSSSWSFPGQTHEHYALGRASIGNLIPKPTTALTAAKKAYIDLNLENMDSFSYRTPHSIVSSADITLKVSKAIKTEELKIIINDFQNTQTFNIIKTVNEPLVSIDFLKSPFAANLDMRWSKAKQDLIKLVLWYDNEWGYASQVVNQLNFLKGVYS